MPHRIDRVAELHDPLDAAHGGNLEAPVAGERVDFRLVHLLLVEDNHAPGRLPELMFHVRLDVRDEVVKSELVRDFAVDDGVLALLRRRQLGLVNGYEMDVFNELTRSMRVCTNALHSSWVLLWNGPSHRLS